MIRDTFKQSFKHERLAHQLTQEELGQLLGVEGRTIGHYEQGERTPNFEKIMKLCEAFDCGVIIRKGGIFSSLIRNFYPQQF